MFAIIKLNIVFYYILNFSWLLTFSFKIGFGPIQEIKCWLNELMIVRMNERENVQCNTINIKTQFLIGSIEPSLGSNYYLLFSNDLIAFILEKSFIIIIIIW